MTETLWVIIILIGLDKFEVAEEKIREAITMCKYDMGEPHHFELLTVQINGG